MESSQKGAGEATAAAPRPIATPTAIIHDWVPGLPRSKRVLEAMQIGVFAVGNEPDIFTFHTARKLLPDDFARMIVLEPGVSQLPGIRQCRHDPGRWRYLLPYMPRHLRRLPASSHAAPYRCGRLKKLLSETAIE
jgi:hypothetical protein